MDKDAVAKAFPHVKVNKRTCRVVVQGFERKFATSSTASFFSIAKLANAYYDAGARYWASLSVLSKILSLILAKCTSIFAKWCRERAWCPKS
jgi:hypothetical protein